MKIRNGKEFTTQPWIQPSQDHLDELKRKRDLHRLFNPKKARRQPSSYAEELTRIRNFKHDNLVEGRRIVNDPKFRLGVAPRIARVAPKLLNRAPHINKVSTHIPCYLEVHYKLVELGWKPKVPNVRRRTKRQWLRNAIKRNYCTGTIDTNCRIKRDRKTGRGKFGKLIKRVA